MGGSEGRGFWTDEEIEKKIRSWEEATGKGKSHRAYGISQSSPQIIKYGLIKDTSFRGWPVSSVG